MGLALELVGRIVFGDVALVLAVGLVTLGDVALDLDSDWFFFKPLLLGGAWGLEDFLPKEKRGASLPSFGGDFGDLMLFCFLRPVARPGRAASFLTPAILPLGRLLLVFGAMRIFWEEEVSRSSVLRGKVGISNALQHHSPRKTLVSSGH